MIVIFEKSLIYLAEHPPGYPLPSQDKSAKQKSALHSRALSSYIYYPVLAARMFGGFTSSPSPFVPWPLAKNGISEEVKGAKKIKKKGEGQRTKLPLTYPPYSR